MPDPINPYVAPQADIREPLFVQPEDIGLWRQGDLLVMHESARFPLRCILTGEETAHLYSWQVRNFWSAFYVTVPLSDGYVRQYRLQLLGCIALAVVSICGGAYWIWPAGWMPFAGILAALLWYGASLQPLRLYTWDGDYLWIADLSPKFLADLPEWPYAPR